MAITKLQQILDDRGLSQGDLRRLIKENTRVVSQTGRLGKGFTIGRDRLSKMCNGILINPSLQTMVLISEALEVTIDDICELKNIKKTNRV